MRLQGKLYKETLKLNHLCPFQQYHKQTHALLQNECQRKPRNSEGWGRNPRMKESSSLRKRTNCDGNLTPYTRFQQKKQLRKWISIRSSSSTLCLRMSQKMKTSISISEHPGQLQCISNGRIRREGVQTYPSNSLPSDGALGALCPLLCCLEHRFPTCIAASQKSSE